LLKVCHRLAIRSSFLPGHSHFQQTLPALRLFPYLIRGCFCMEDRINRQNLDADYRTRGKWAQIMDQFSNQENIKSVYKDFWDMRPNLPKNMKLSDFGSADGLFGSFFKKELEMQGYSVHLTIIDIIQ